MDETPVKKRPHDDEEASGLLCKKQKFNSQEQISEGRLTGEIILLDSEEEGEQFQTEKKRKRKNRTEGSVDDCNRDLFPSTPTCKELTDEVEIMMSDSQILCTTPTNPRSVKNAFHILKSASSTGKKRDSALKRLKDTSEESSKWPCSACTFLNHAGLSRCEICDTPGKVKDVDKSNSCKSQTEEDLGPSSPLFGRKKKSCPYVMKADREHLLNDETGTMAGIAELDVSSQSSTQADHVCHDGANGRSVDSGDGEKRKCVVLEESTPSCVSGEKFSVEDHAESSDLHAVEIDIGLSDSSLSEDDLISGATATPKPRKRKCFMLHSDSDEEISDRPESGNKEDISCKVTDQCVTIPIGRDDGCMSTQVGDDNRCISTPVDCEKQCLKPLVSNKDQSVSTPLSHDGRSVSVTSSWELMPCDSPCFSLVLDSSDDQSDDSVSNTNSREARGSGDKHTHTSVSKDRPCFSLGLDASDDEHNELIAEPQDLGDHQIPVALSMNMSQTKSHINDSDCNFHHLLEDSDLQSSMIEDEQKLPALDLPRRSADSPVLRKTSSSRLLSESNRSTTDSRHQNCKTDADDKSHSSGSHDNMTPGKHISPDGAVFPTQVFSTFLYCCSFYTGRVYLFKQDGEPLNENFLPLDVEMGNMEQLPAVLHHPGNLRLVQKFVREWNSLTETKKRLIVKQGMLFSSPLVAYEEVRSGKVSNTQRHKTKDDAAMVARKAAVEVSGTVRLISKKGQTGSLGSHDTTHQTHNTKGVLQAVTSEGVPLCLNCQQPYQNPLLDKSSVTDEKNAWNTRFCSSKCMDQYWMQTHSSYCREKVYEVEHGICQICKYDAHSFYIQVKSTQDIQKRARLLAEGKYSTLKTKQKELIVRKPVAGQFWHVDHITPVWEGGGMCDIDNMRTLCVVCHQKVTAGQARKRAVVRRLQGARAGGDITAFFQKT